MSEELRQRFKRDRLKAMPEIGKAISAYCAAHDIKNVIFLDRSARPAYVPFKKSWEQSRGRKSRPSIYFMAPKTMEEYGVGEDEVELFKKEQPYLNRAREQGTLVFDVCIKDGMTLHNTYELLRQSGFTDIHTMVTAAHDDREHHFTPDKILNDNHVLGCHLFGAFYNGEVGVERNGYSLLSKRSPYRTANVRRNRKELSDAVLQ